MGRQRTGYANRHVKNQKTLDGDAQKRLQQAHVLVAGAGGLGGYVIESLARMGIGQLTLVDGDRFEASNLNRQLFCLEDNLGSLKAEVARARVKTIDRDVACTIVPEYLDSKGFATYMASVSLVVDALGGLSAHRQLSQACRQEGKPLVIGAVAGWTGCASTVVPGGPSPASLWQAEDAKDAEAVLGSLSPVVACIASVQCAEAVALLTGLEPWLAGKMLLVDLRQGLFETFRL